MREHFEYVHDLLFQQQHEIYVTTHQRRPTDKQTGTQCENTIERVLMSASFLILAVIALTCASLRPSLSWSERDLTAFHPVSREPMWT